MRQATGGVDGRVTGLSAIETRFFVGFSSTFLVDLRGDLRGETTMVSGSGFAGGGLAGFITT